MARANQKSDLQNFTIFHNEFIESEILNAHEKLVFMAIKRHLNKNNKAFPGLSTISKYSRLSKSTVQKTLKTLEDKGIIKIERRQDKENGGNKSNEYTLYDYKSMWIASDEKEMKQVMEEIEEQKNLASLTDEELDRRLEELKRERDRRKNKEKEPVSDSDQTTDTDSKHSIDNYNTDEIKNQSERYTLDQIRQIYNYDVMIHDNPEWQQDIDVVIQILYDVLNTIKQTIRVSGEDKPAMIVIAKLMKLTFQGITYAIRQYKKQTGRVKNPTGYMLTLLYNAEEQMHLDITNKVTHDMNT